MNEYQMKKYQREQRRLKQIEEDLMQEKILRDEMTLIKAKVDPKGQDLYFERIKGRVLVEGKED